MRGDISKPREWTILLEGDLIAPVTPMSPRLLCDQLQHIGMYLRITYKEMECIRLSVPLFDRWKQEILPSFVDQHSGRGISVNLTSRYAIWNMQAGEVIVEGTRATSHIIAISSARADFNYPLIIHLWPDCFLTPPEVYIEEVPHANLTLL